MADCGVLGSLVGPIIFPPDNPQLELELDVVVLTRDLLILQKSFFVDTEKHQKLLLICSQIIGQFDNNISIVI